MGEDTELHCFVKISWSELDNSVYLRYFCECLLCRLICVDNESEQWLMHISTFWAAGSSRGSPDLYSGDVTFDSRNRCRLFWIRIRSSVFWNVVLRWLADCYRLLRTMYWSHLQGSSIPSPSKAEPIHCPETSAQRNYQPTPLSIP
jgi:hypothetical protein